MTATAPAAAHSSIVASDADTTLEPGGCRGCAPSSSSRPRSPGPEHRADEKALGGGQHPGRDHHAVRTG